jgi:hypothetical protein
VTITTRPASEVDVPALLALYAELHPHDPAPSTEAAAGAWRAIEAQAGRVVLLAESDGVVAGTIDCATLPNLTRGTRPFMLNCCRGSAVKQRTPSTSRWAFG